MGEIYFIILCEKLKTDENGFFDLGRHQIVGWAGDYYTAKDLVENDDLNAYYVIPFKYAIVEAITEGNPPIAEDRYYFKLNEGQFEEIDEPKDYELLTGAVIW